MTEETRVIKRFKPFILGKCQCGCNEDIEIRTSHHLKRYKSGHQNPFKKDSNNPMWKGDKVGIEALHNYIHIRLPKPEFCEICNINKPRDLANITGIYNRNIENWKYLCRGCHVSFDLKNPTAFIDRDLTTGRFVRKNI